MIEAAEFTTAPVAALAPNLTVEPLMIPVPVMVTVVPAVSGPAFGLTDHTTGVP